MEGKIFVRTKQLGKEGTEYSGGFMLLTFSVIFQLTWLYKGQRNKLTSPMASSF